MTLNLMMIFDVVKDGATRPVPIFTELLFGSIMIFILNYLVMTYLFKIKLPLWRHIVLMLCSAAAFIINTVLHESPYYTIYIYVYGVAFFVAHHFLMWRTADIRKSFAMAIPGIMLAFFYTFGVMSFEGTFRALVYTPEGLRAMLIYPRLSKYLIFYVLEFSFIMISYIIYTLLRKSYEKKKKKEAA